MINLRKIVHANFASAFNDPLRFHHEQLFQPTDGDLVHIGGKEQLLFENLTALFCGVEVLPFGHRACLVMSPSDALS
jgi:hypothetical protein